MKPDDLSGADVIRIAEKYGFEVLLNEGPPPQPFLRGDSEKVTEPLMGALKAFREEIIEELRKREP